MARFCGNCGVQLDTDAKVCGQCGTPVMTTKTQKKNPEKKKKILKKIKWGAFFALIVIVALMTYKITSNFIGNKGLVRKVMKAYEKYDIDTLILLSSDIYFYADDKDYVEYYFESCIGNNLDSFESTIGHRYKFSYEIREIYTMSEHRKDRILKDLEYLYPEFDIGLISDFSVAEVSITAKKGNNSVKREIEIIMTKENDNWKILYIE